jgi:hypothetical protein
MHLLTKVNKKVSATDIQRRSREGDQRMNITHAISTSNHIIAIRDHFRAIVESEGACEQVSALETHLDEILAGIEKDLARELHLVFDDKRAEFISESITRKKDSMFMVIPGVVKCARCGNDHALLRFKRMDKPSGSNTHWAMCPFTGDPIMLSIESAE